MEVVQAPNPILRTKTKLVKQITPDHLKIFREMIKLTNTFNDPEGVGLASTQIGKNEQFFVAKQTDGSFKSYINPQILSTAKKTKLLFEGCLSIPNYWGEVQRFPWVRVSYLNEKGEKIVEKLTGFSSHVFQHEFDHLQGILFIDKVLAQKNKLFKVVGKDKAGGDIFEEVKI